MILKKKYSGITVPVLTPVLPDETVDEQGYRRLIQSLLDNGIHGVFICGTLGETMTLTQAERDRAIRIAGLRRLRARYGIHVPQGICQGIRSKPHRRCGADA